MFPSSHLHSPLHAPAAGCAYLLVQLAESPPKKTWSPERHIKDLATVLWFQTSMQITPVSFNLCVTVHLCGRYMYMDLASNVLMPPANVPKPSPVLNLAGKQCACSYFDRHLFSLSACANKYSVLHTSLHVVLSARSMGTGSSGNMLRGRWDLLLLLNVSAFQNCPSAFPWVNLRECSWKRLAFLPYRLHPVTDRLGYNLPFRTSDKVHRTTGPGITVTELKLAWILWPLTTGNFQKT